MAFQYKVPIIGQKRMGTESDPYIQITNDVKKIVDGYCKLNEIPDDLEHVTITSVASPYQAEVYTETFDKVNPIGQYNYLVDYKSGLVYFNTSSNGRIMTFSYYGKGVQFLSASRIFTKETGGEVTQTLDDALSFLETIIDTEGITIVEDSAINGNIKINGAETNVYIHPGSGTNPHNTTKADVGLGNVDNTSDVDKPVSTAIGNALNGKEKTITKGTTAPVSPSIGDLWLDTN